MSGDTRLRISITLQPHSSSQTNFSTRRRRQSDRTPSQSTTSRYTTLRVETTGQDTAPVAMQASAYGKRKTTRAPKNSTPSHFVYPHVFLPALMPNLGCALRAGLHDSQPVTSSPRVVNVPSIFADEFKEHCGSATEDTSTASPGNPTPAQPPLGLKALIGEMTSYVPFQTIPQPTFTIMGRVHAKKSRPTPATAPLDTPAQAAQLRAETKRKEKALAAVKENMAPISELTPVPVRLATSPYALYL
ncbi:hypothetical protein C8T65DRAFT_730539 [Cerioporus squamosus]|nr:hypothetical protein C8T65DRAFT_730539 [Cerioporus squamosus]